MRNMTHITFGQWNASNLEYLEKSFEELANHLKSNNTDILILPELPFDSWFCAIEEFELQRWKKSIRLHEEWLDKLNFLEADIIIGTKPYSNDNLNANVAWVSSNSNLEIIHGKRYVPNETGFWEANWYGASNDGFHPYKIGDLTIGTMICTDLWFFQHARELGKEGIHLLVNPRSTELATIDKWRFGCQTASVVSGAFVVSSNHVGVAEDGKTQLGGHGFLVNPDGKLLGESNNNKPWVTLEVDLVLAEIAKSTYPRYVI